MAKSIASHIVSANDLFAGDVVYLTPLDGWSGDLRDAAVADGPDAAKLLLDRAQQPDRVVGPYLVEADIGPTGRPEPVHFRERFRERGPSIDVDLARKAGHVPTAQAHIAGSPDPSHCQAVAESTEGGV